MQWFKDRDANSEYFYSLIIGRKRRLYIHRIKDEDGNWIQGDVAREHFENMFTETDGIVREDLLTCIPSLITDEDDAELTKDPTM